MSKCKTDFLFPPDVITSLTSLRGLNWQSFVEGIAREPYHSINTIAFTYMMVKINNCQTCNSDSFRAMNGCVICSTQSVSRYRGSDSDLIELFEISKLDVENFLRKREK